MLLLEAVSKLLVEERVHLILGKWKYQQRDAFPVTYLVNLYLKKFYFF